jgi:hypothetical protein
LAEDYFLALKGYLEPSSGIGGSTHAIQDSETAINLLLNFPPKAVSREERESLLNLLLDFIVGSVDLEGDVAFINRQVYLAILFLNAPSSTCNFCTGKTRWALVCEKLARYPYEDMHHGARALFRAAFRQIFAEPGLPRNKEVIEVFSGVLAYQHSKKKKYKWEHQTRSLLLLLTNVWLSQTSFPEGIETVRELVENFTGRLSRDLQRDIDWETMWKPEFSLLLEGVKVISAFSQRPGPVNEVIGTFSPLN